MAIVGVIVGVMAGAIATAFGAMDIAGAGGVSILSRVELEVAA